MEEANLEPLHEKINNIENNDVPIEIDGTFLLETGGKDSDDTLHAYILQYNDKEITINVNQETADKLASDHSYAEQYLAAMEEIPVINHISNATSKPDGAQVSVGQKLGSQRKPKIRKKSHATSSDGFWSWTYHGTQLFVTERLQLESEFQNPDSVVSALWKQLAEKLNADTKMAFTPEACSHKWRNMVTTYKVHLKKVKETGQNTSWPFYDLFYEAYGEEPIMPRPVNTTRIAVSSAGTPNSSYGRNHGKIQNMFKSETNMLLASRLGMESLFAEPGANADELWKAVANEVGLNIKIWTNPVQACKDRWITLLNLYQTKVESGYPEEEHLVWPFFTQFDEVYHGHVPAQYLKELSIRDGGLWTMPRVKRLFQLRIGMSESFDEPKAKKSQLWIQIADELNEIFPEICVNGAECDEKYRSMLKSYRTNVRRLAEKGYVNWPYFQMMQNAFGGTPQMTRAFPSRGHSISKIWSGKNVELLIKFRLEMENMFTRRRCKLSSLWFAIAKKLNLATDTTQFSWTTCLCKWRKLKLNYDYIIEKSRKTGVLNTVWPYFKIFDEMYGGTESHETPMVDSSQDDDDDGANNGGTADNCDDIASTDYIADDDGWEAYNYLEQAKKLRSMSAHVENLPTITSKIGTRNSSVTKSPSKGSVHQQDDTDSALNRHIHVQPASSSRTFASRQPTLSGRTPQRSHVTEQGPSSDSNLNVGSRFSGNPAGDTIWLRDMLLDWKKERLQRWAEKKKLEQEKIQALNRLTDAILSLESTGAERRENVLRLHKSGKRMSELSTGYINKKPKMSEEI